MTIKKFLKKLILNVVIVQLAGTFGSCVSPKPPVITEVQNFHASLKEIKPTAGFDIIVKNDNPWSVKLASIDTDLKLQNRAVGKINLQKKIKIRANSSTAVPVVIDLD